ncbi:MAG: hypothetical protein V3U65_16110 [Granulosicoccaceae bacterium]
MNNVEATDIVPSSEFSVDEDALRLLEADLAAKQSVRSVKTPFKLLIDDLSIKLFKNKITTVAVIGVVLGCSTVIYWNLFMRMPNPEARVTLESDNIFMSERLNILSKKISSIDHFDLDEKLEAESSRVFSGFPSLAVWINQLLQTAKQFDLKLAYKIEDASAAPVEGVLKVPVILTISSAPGRSNTVFSNSMALFSKMLADPWHLDIVSTAARGGSNGLTKMDVAIHVWLSDSDGYARIHTENESTLIADIDSDEEFTQ